MADGVSQSVGFDTNSPHQDSHVFRSVIKVDHIESSFLTAATGCLF